MANKAYQIAFSGTAVDEGFYGDVVSLTVEENTGTANTFHLQIALRLQDDGSWTYLDDDRLALFNAVTIQVGFTDGGGLAAAAGSLPGGGDSNDGLKTVFDGYITNVDVDLGSEPDNAFIKVSGMDTSVLMSLEEKIATWLNMADSDIVQQIVGGYGVAVQADTTTTVHQEDDTTIVQRGTDIQFVRDLAQKNGMEFYFETDDTGTVNAYFRAPQLSDTPQPDLAIQFGDQSNLKSFYAHLSGQRPLNVKASQMDVAANSANTAQVSDMQLNKLGDKDANSLIGGPLGSLVTPKDAMAQMLVLGPPTSDATEMQTIVQAVRDEAGWLIAAHGEINSDAYQSVLRPHRLVLVKGAGTTYSGKYYVTKVVHEMNHEGDYIQRFEARRNARDLDGSEQFGSSSAGLAIPGI
ncbi:MAG TPA: contractile injection system protein, VgrG/Pvc8 family [Alloacidobacterium sp.]|nr:contractile injection system protein, VgrG/Pvc8 family [Alloacidobacterium sp.]